MEPSRFRDAAADAIEVGVVVRSEDTQARTPIWIVALGDSAYVRSYRATGGRWYQHVLSSGTFPLEIDGEEVLVRLEAVEDAETLEAVSAAYLTKYANEAETPDMVSPAVVATTLRLDPVNR